MKPRNAAGKRPSRAADAPRRDDRRAGAVRSGPSSLLARDLMTPSPITVPEEMTVGELCDLLQEKNINGAPVVDGQGRLVGVVTQEDIIYGAMGHPGAGAEPAEALPAALPPETTGRRRGKRMVAMLRERALRSAPAVPARAGERPFWSDRHRPADPMGMPVRAIMTSPAISADEETSISDLCRIMWNLRIHRVPILRDGKVTGMVSSMDLCRAILDGTIDA